MKATRRKRRCFDPAAALSKRSARCYMMHDDPPGLEPGRRRLDDGVPTVTATGDDFDRRGGGARARADRSGRQTGRGPAGRVKNGGCAGMSYTMELAETAAPTDEVVEDKGVKLLIDPKAVLFLLGAQMDFKVDRLSATFAFSNPNETSACGCGESVAITPASPEALHAPA